MTNMLRGGVVIGGVACAVPKNVKRVSEFSSAFGAEAVSSFEEKVGVHAVRVSSEEQAASDLCFAAAERLLNEFEVDRLQIGVLVFVSQTPDYRLPATAFVLAHRLGLSQECFAFDVNLGCSGYVYGLNIASALMESCGAEYGLLLTGDTVSKLTSDLDRSSCMLFGDAGGATLLKRDSMATPMHGEFCNDGSGFKAIVVPSGAFRNTGGSSERTEWPIDGNVRSDFDLYMNGTDVFSFTISKVPRLIKDVMAQAGTTPDDYDAFVLHQANGYILEQVAKRAKMPIEKVPVTLDRFGNTSVASIPLTICDRYAGEDGPRRVLMCGFGVGLSWGVVDAALDVSRVLPIIETDESYSDGAVSHD